MMQNQNYPNSHGSAADVDISLSNIVANLWRSRWAIVIVTVSVTFSVVAGSAHFARYKSEGFFQFGGAIPISPELAAKEHGSGILLSDYKRYVVSYATRERFADYARDKKLELTVDVDGLYKTFESVEGISKLVEPVYPFTKLDARELMDQPKDGSNNVIGLRINYSSDSSESAQQMVGLLGDYVMDSIIYQTCTDKLQFKRGEVEAEVIKLENIIIENRELLAKYHRKSADLKQIVSRYPESAKQVTRQVISVTEDSARYLSPITLLETVEVQVSEANEAIHKAKRELKQKALWLEYFDKAKALLDGTKSGGKILRGLDIAKESVFKGKDMDDDVIKEIYNTITIDNQKAFSVYLEKSRFIAGPTLPTHSSYRPLLTLALGLISGLLLSVLLVFLRNWWRNSWQKVFVEK